REVTTRRGFARTPVLDDHRTALRARGYPDGEQEIRPRVYAVAVVATGEADGPGTPAGACREAAGDGHQGARRAARGGEAGDGPVAAIGSRGPRAEDAAVS